LRGHRWRGPQVGAVEETAVAGILGRKRRLRLAEAYRRGLEDTLAPYRETAKAALVHLDATSRSEQVFDAIQATAADTAEEIAEMEANERMARRALDLLGSSRNDAYEAALAAPGGGTRVWWENELAREPEELEEDEDPAPRMPRTCAASSKAKCCRGSRHVRFLEIFIPDDLVFARFVLRCVTADAVRFAIDELPPKLHLDTYLKVDEVRFDGDGIVNPEYPLARRAATRGRMR